MTAPDVASFRRRFGLTVTPENVLGVRAVVLEEAQRLQTVLDTNGQNTMLPPLGADPVSRDMSREFNKVTEGLLKRAQDHLNSLFGLGDELAAAAEAYGHTEQAIKDSFTGAPTAVGQLPPVLRQAIGMGVASGRPPAGSLGGLMTGGPG